MTISKVCYILIDSTSQIIKAEKLLKSQTLQFELVPKPRQLTSDCGMCIACKLGQEKAVIQALIQANINVGSIYYLESPETSFLAKLLVK